MDYKIHPVSAAIIGVAIVTALSMVWAVPIDGVTVPYWILFIACLVATRWSRRFSLRTLLMATTAAAIALGMFASLR
jgi:hypothetical protein